MIKLMRGSGKLSFGKALFRSVKLMNILHFPFDFFTNNMLDSYSR